MASHISKETILFFVICNVFDLQTKVISKKFVQSSFIYTVAGTLPMASGFVLLPFYILYLPKEVYGAFALCLAVSAFVQIVVTYSFDTSLYIHYHELRADKQKLSSFISSAFIFILLLGAFVIVTTMIGGHFVFSLLLKDSSLSFFPNGFIAVCVGALQAIFKVHSNLLQTREKPETFFWSNVVSFSFVAILTIVGLKVFPQTLVGPLGSRLLTGSLLGVWVLFRVFKEFGFHYTSPWKNTSFHFNAFTFVYQLQQWAVNYIDRFIILIFMPSAAMASVGIYEFAMKCMAPIELLLNGLNASINPRITQLLTKQGEKKQSTPEINRYFYGLVSVILLVGCAAVFSFPYLIKWLISSTDYIQALQYLPFIATIYIAKATRLYFIMPFTVLKEMKRLASMSFLVTGLKVILMIIMIKYIGIYGLILATVIIYGIELILLWVTLRSHYSISFNFLKLIGVPYLMIAGIVTTELLLPGGNGIAHLVYLGVTTLLLLIAYRNEVKLLKTIIRK